MTKNRTRTRPISPTVSYSLLSDAPTILSTQSREALW